MRFATVLAVIALSLAMAGNFTVNVPFSATDVEINQMGNYTVVTFPGTSTMGNIGAPALPVMNSPIALPAGMQATGIEVINASYEPLLGNYTVLPATEPVPLSLMGETEILLPAPDRTIYNSSESFPSAAARFEESSMLIGFPVAYVSIYPVRWNPASGTIEVLRNLEIRVTTEEATDNYSVRTRSAQSEARTRTIVENSVLNPEMVQASGAAIVPSRDLMYGEYVVISTTAYQSYAQAFADWKTRKGVPTSVYTTTWIQSQYSCADLQQEIRAFLTDCRDEGVEYVLIWGDDNIIAGRDSKIHYSSYTEYPPVDLYWSDINDSSPGADLWNSNGNGIWGEWGAGGDNVDYHPDMFTGRASVNSTSEATLFLSKVLAYEQVGSTDYFESAPVELRVGYTTSLLWPGCWGSAGAEIISNDLPSSAWEEEKCYESTGNNSVAITTGMLNAGPANVYHSSHGGPTSFSLPGGSYGVSSFMALQNISNGGLPAIWHSISCLIGHLDNYECMGDAWIASPNGGGFGCFNARYGWGSPSNPGGGVSEVLTQRVYEEDWVEGQIALGAIHSMGRDEMSPYTQEIHDWVVKEYNLFGEPELPVWTADAPNIAAAHPASIPGATTVTVTVTSGGSAISGARVCLWKGDDWATAEVYEVENTNGSGVVNIPVAPSTTGQMLITVWAHNYISYLGTITVSGAGIEEQGEGTTYVTAISTPYPNPAANNAAIPFSLANAGTAEVQVFDLTGRTVATPASGDFAAGQHTINWDLTGSNGASIPNGFYSVVITTGDTVMTERIMVLR
ncbi:MAG: T9SS type A sorting domain-containing protein [Candidatus Sabulitectum sp.]|nr:T9SS type A sorting domain-containing protein [Candidatus Sabulitectum sp.]